MYEDEAARKCPGGDAQSRGQGKPGDGDSEPDPRSKEASEAAEERPIERARTHPVRIAILGLLERHAEDEALTTRQVRDRLSEQHGEEPSLATVAYHLLALLQEKLVSATRLDADCGAACREWKLA